MSKIKRKLTENGDKAYTSTGNKLVDIFFGAEYYQYNIEKLPLLSSNKDKHRLFSMFMRDPRFGQGRKDIGRRLMAITGIKPEDIIKVGRFDDLWHNPTEANIEYLKYEVFKGNTLAKKWMPRLTSKNKAIAKTFCKYWNISEKEYRQLIKEETTTEYKLSYHEIEYDNNANPLEKAFNTNKKVNHPLWETIKFSEVPSLAMLKYSKLFSTNENFKIRFSNYISDVKEGKDKVNTATTTVYDVAKKATNETTNDQETILQTAREQITKDITLDCICVLDTSASMTWVTNGNTTTPYKKAMSVAHSLSLASTYCPGQLISFSSSPKLMTIKGTTLKEQYASMHTGDVTNTDLAKVMNILSTLERFPKYIIVLSDMEFDKGSKTSKEEFKKIVKEKGADTKLIWWNFNDRTITVPEKDKYGNFYVSGYDLKVITMLTPEGMKEYLNKLLNDYAIKIGYSFK